MVYAANDEGCFYLGGIKDLVNGELPGNVLDERMMQNFVIQALFRDENS